MSAGKRCFPHCRLSVVRGFSDDQVDCMCEALLQQYPGSRSRLVMLISSLSSSQLGRSDSEHLLRARAVVAFHTERFTELYAILAGSHVFHPAHHPLLQKVLSCVGYMSSLLFCGGTSNVASLCRKQRVRSVAWRDSLFI